MGSKGTKVRKPKPPPLNVIVTGVPCEDYQQLYDEAIDALAEALADRVIAKARAQVAAELGIDPESLRGPASGLPALESELADEERIPRRRR